MDEGVTTPHEPPAALRTLYGWSMAERTIAILPCPDLDEVVSFYDALGFTVTYRQARPNPYLCLQRGGIELHFCAVAGFDPETSLGSVIVLVADTGALYDDFAAGLRTRYGRLPISGRPRITRPRRKQGTAAGFSVVDPGGNWLRVTSGAGDQSPDPPTAGLDRVLRNAARQGDARGDEAAAISVLEAGLLRHRDAPPVERVPLLVYLVELLVRAGDRDGATATLGDLSALELGAVDRAAVAAELATAVELERDLRGDEPGG